MNDTGTLIRQLETFIQSSKEHSPTGRERMYWDECAGPLGNLHYHLWSQGQHNVSVQSSGSGVVFSREGEIAFAIAPNTYTRAEARHIAYHDPHKMEQIRILLRAVVRRLRELDTGE